MGSSSSSEKLANDVVHIGYVIASQTPTHIRAAGAIDRSNSVPMLKQPVFDAVLRGDKWDLELLPRTGQLQVVRHHLSNEELIVILKKEFEK